MSNRWFYIKNGKEEGPVSSDTLKNLLRYGIIDEETLVKCEGMTQWEKASFYNFTKEKVNSDNINYTPNYQSNSCQVKYAGFWKRTFAFMIDGILLSFVVWIIGSLLSPFTYVFMTASLGELPEQDILTAGAVGSIMLYNMAGFVVNWLYFCIFESSSWQATIGKKLLNIKVVDEKMGRITFLRATGRYFGKSLSILTLGIGYMMAGWTNKKQALHDKIAKTYVISTK